MLVKKILNIQSFYFKELSVTRENPTLKKKLLERRTIVKYTREFKVFRYT